MKKIEGYEDCHIVNESNGGEIRQGEAAPVGVHSAEDDRQKTCPSPNPIEKAAKAMAALHGDDKYYDDESYLLWLDEAEVAFKVFMGDAAIRKDVGRESNPSPTRTREELVEVMFKEIAVPSEKVTYESEFRESLHRALDALIAIGAVRVK